MRLDFTSACILLATVFAVGVHASPTINLPSFSVPRNDKPPRFNDHCNYLTPSSNKYCNLIMSKVYPVSRDYPDVVKFPNAATIANDIVLHAKTCVAFNALATAQQKGTEITSKTEAFKKGKEIHLTVTKLTESTERIIPSFWDNTRKFSGGKMYRLNEQDIKAFKAFLETTYTDIEKHVTRWEKRHKFARAKVVPGALDEATVHKKCLTLTKKFFDGLIAGLHRLLEDGKRPENMVYSFIAFKTDLKDVLDDLRKDISTETQEDVPLYHKSIHRRLYDDGQIRPSSRSNSIRSVSSVSSAKPR